MTKILVIEDEPTLRQEIMDWLNFENYDVEGASDGVEGVNQAVVFEPDLIISDINMPRMDGYGVLLDIQANSELQSTPFIFLSAKANKEDIRKGMHLGADDYLTKPFTNEDLLKAIATRLSKRTTQEVEIRHQVDIFKHALEIEHQERLLNEKLVSMLAHDFRSQLTVIASSAAFLRDYSTKIAEQKRTERLTLVENSARLLMSMLDDALSMAQLKTGMFTLSLQPVLIADYVRDLIEEFDLPCDQSCCIRFEGTFNEPIQSDPRLLRQIVGNLLSNAIKYSPNRGEVVVAVGELGNNYAIIVKDSGIGISEADQARLFESFKRGSNVGKIPGTGLGLAIVKQAVDTLEGWINVESHLGQGTTITVTLPRL